MPRTELTALISKLKVEIAQLRDDQRGSRDQIESLIHDLETHLASGKTQDWSAEMSIRLRNEIEQFETEHPQVTGVLNNIMVTLSGMGV
jgi:hypothetical protein